MLVLGLLTLSHALFLCHIPFAILMSGRLTCTGERAWKGVLAVLASLLLALSSLVGS